MARSINGPAAQPGPHLRDAATICPATTTLSNGLVINRCERDAGHDGKHKDGCSHWGNDRTADPSTCAANC